MHNGTPLSALSEAWEAVTIAKKELTNVDTKIRQSGVIDSSKNLSFGNASRRSKDNPNIERRVVLDYPAQRDTYRKENVPPAAYPQPKFYTNFPYEGKETNMAVRYAHDYAPDFNYVARNPSQEKGILNSSLSGKVLLSKKNDSNALNRLKEKINQQKMNASILSSTCAQDALFPPRSVRHKEDPVEAVEKESFSRGEIMKRKVTTAPTAPTYKGFNQADGHSAIKPPITTGTFHKPKGNLRGSKGRVSSENKMKRKVKAKEQKMQRIVSPKKPMPPITTSTWRVGQEIRENILRERRSKKGAAVEVQEEAPAVKEAPTSATSVCVYAENESGSKKTSESVTSKEDIVVSKDDQETVMEEVSMPSDSCHGISDKSAGVSKVEIVTEISTANDANDVRSSQPGDSKIDFNIDTSKTSGSETKDSKPMSKNAMSILNDLKAIPKAIDKSSVEKSKKVRGVIDTGLKKKPKTKQSVSLKRKAEEDGPPKQKMRHYNQEEIQKYMQKQQAQRKQQRLKEKKEQEEREKLQQQKLKELYDKQQKAVKENLEIGKRNAYGETFVKLSSKISSIMSTNPSSSSCNTNHESTDVSSSLDVPTYAIPQQASSPRYRIDNTVDEVFKDSLDITAATIAEKSMQAQSLQPISPYKPSISNITNEFDQPCIDVETKPGPSDVSSKASRVAAIHSTAAALRKRLDMEAKRISSLVQNRQGGLNNCPSSDDVNMAPAELDIPEPQGFSGEIPGTHNIDEQANLNMKLRKMEEAAKKIQSFYRGHCTRKSIDWKLPSGKTLFQAFEGARRSALLSGSKGVTPVTLASHGYPPITFPLKGGKKTETSIKMAEPVSIKMAEPVQLDNSDLLTNMEKLLHKEARSISPTSDGELLPMKDVNLVLSDDEHGSTASLISEAMTISKALQQDARKPSRMSNKTSKSSLNSDGNSFPSYSGGNGSLLQEDLLQRVGEKAESLRKVLEKHKKVPGDEYSVINIFTRKYPSLRRQQLLDDVKVSSSESELDTEKIIAEAYDDELKSLKDAGEDDNDDDVDDNDDLTEQSLEEMSLEESLEDTLVEQSIHDAALSTSSAIAKKDESDHSVTLSLADLPSKIQSKADSSKRTAGYSQDLVTKSKSLFTSQDVDSDVSLSSQGLSSCQSNAFSDIDAQDLKPVFSSTQRSMDTSKELTSEPSKTYTPVLSDRGDYKHTKAQDARASDGNVLKMSPNTLERKLKAEINLFESVGSSLQQVTEMERVRNVVDAQQEVVTLAQVLKSRQLAHQKELEKLSLAAKESAMASAQEVETVKRAAAEATVDVMKTIAEVKAKAAEEIAASAVQLAQIQQQTTLTTMEALNQVEQARQAAATAYKQSVDQQAKVHINSDRSLEHMRSQSNGYSDDFEDGRSVGSNQSSEDGSKDSTLKQTNTAMSNLEASAELITTKDVSNTPVSGTVIEESINKTPHTSDATTRSSKTNHSSTILEDLASESLVKTSKMNKDASENGDCSEILFEQKTLLSLNEDSFSGGNSEDKVNSSLTEEDLKHDFRMVLPSENHRRKSLDCMDNFLMTNDTSSDELVVTPRAAGKWIKKIRSKSPAFADENTFTKFTANMVRQYIQEDEVRAKHQAALLGLREKAIIEKTKAEMAYLEVQKKALKSKGTDEKMPPITKKQRAVLMRLQAEQSEIRRLKEAHKAASYERKSMLYQQKQIQKIRESTQKIWSKLEHMNKSDVSARNDENEEKSESLLQSSFTPDSKVWAKQEDASLSQYEKSFDVPEEASQISERLQESETASIEESIEKEENSKTESSSAHTAETSQPISPEKDTSLQGKDLAKTSANETVSPTSKAGVSNTFHDSMPDDSSMADALKKLMYKSGKKYLTSREKKLENRKHQFNEIMKRETQLKEWRQKIIDEESKLKEDIHRALHRGHHKADTTVSSRSETTTKSTTSYEQANISNSSFQTTVKETNKSRSAVINGENISVSVQEEYVSAKDSQRSIDESIAEQLLDDASPSQKKSSSSQSIVEDEKSAVSHSLSHRYSTETFAEESQPSLPRKSTTAGSPSSKKVEDDSLTENTSDTSDIEQRLKGLQDEIESRNLELERLRKKNQKELLRLKEQELKRQLNDVNQEILREHKDVSPLYSESSNSKSIGQKEDTKSDRSQSKSVHKSSPVSKSRSEIVEYMKQEDIKSDRSRLKSEQKSSPVSRQRSEIEYTVQEDIKSDRSRLKSGDKSPLLSRSKSISSATDLRQLSDNEKDSNTNLSTVHTEARDIDIRSERSLSKSEHKSSPSVISSAADLVLQDAKSSDIKSVSEKLLSDAKSDILSAKYTSNIIRSATISDVIKSYGDDFEESAENGSKNTEKHSETIKSVLTEEDISEISNEILSELSRKSDKNQTSSKGVGNSMGEEVGEKSDKDDTVSTASTVRQSYKTSHKSDLSVTSQKHSTVQSNLLNENKPITYEDSFVSQTSKLSASIPEELSTKVDSMGDVRFESARDEKEESLQLSEKSLSSKSKSDISSSRGFSVNDRVIVEGIMKGVVKFLGRTPFSPVMVAGIHLDEALGTNNGTFQGSKYFDCNDNYGLFTTLDRIKHISHEEKKRDEHIIEVIGMDDKNAQDSPYISPDHSMSSNSLVLKSPHLTSLNLQSNKSVDEEISVASEKDHSAEESLKSLSKNKIEVDNEVDFHVKSYSSSDVESLDTEIPSPLKVDLVSMADSITESILKSILLEAMNVPHSITHKRTVKSSDEMSKVFKNESDQIRPKSPLPGSRSEVPTKYLPNDVNTVTKKLIEDALSHMMKVKRLKQEKLKQDVEISEKELTRKGNLLSLITDGVMDEETKDDILADKEDGQMVGLEDLKSVQDHLDALCGIDDDEEAASMLQQERVILPPKSFRFEEPPLQIPWTIHQTQSLVFSALNELTNDSVTHANLATVEPSTEYFTDDTNNKNFNEHHAKLYKQVVFDATKSILCEINEFHELQKHRPEWMKAPCRTFSKFTRNSYMLDAASLCQVIADYVSTCMDLKEGRPSLEKLKRRLPLNLNKKDYIDAVLVEEIREEEPMWVNYDEDELKVKFQLADDILNNLLQEIVDIIQI